MRLPVQTAVWFVRAAGTLVTEVGSHVSEPGSYRPPVFKPPEPPGVPPHTTIALPVQAAV
jgi:hypothetical protein